MTQREYFFTNVVAGEIGRSSLLEVYGALVHRQERCSLIFGGSVRRSMFVVGLTQHMEGGRDGEQEWNEISKMESRNGQKC